MDLYIKAGMMTPEILQQLLDEYTTGSISPEDRQQLLAALRDPLWADEVANMLQQDLETGRYDAVAAELPEVRERLQQRLSKLIQPAPAVAVTSRNIFPIKWRQTAAALFVLAGLSAAALYLTRSDQQQVGKKTANTAVNIGPGGNKAMLTLSDGSTIPLEQATDGIIAQQGSTRVVKLASGQLAYQLQPGADTTVRWNTISTPRGGEYQVTLPDGTKAWLNAASAITFPVAFTKYDRQVMITGEVYLEVAPSASQPFTVTANDIAVKVLGTSFNVCAYKDEAYTKITLITGSVKIKVRNREWQMKPGQQAAVNTNDTIVRINTNTDIEQTLAWKNGLFNFNGADLHTVMRQLERWYSIQVRYEGPVSDIIFKGEMYKNVNLSDVLEMLKAMDVKFQLKDSTLTVKG